MFRFTIRDVLWLTVVVAMACGWAVDRSSLHWRYQQANAAMERLRERLDAVDADWRANNDVGGGTLSDHQQRWTQAAWLLGLGLFALAITTVVLAWRGHLHWSILMRRRRF
jgi:hypothetical protein